MTTHIEIIIDDLDREDVPEAPLTMNVYCTDELTGKSGDSLAVEVGQDIPAMLRALADVWEAENLTNSIPVR